MQYCLFWVFDWTDLSASGQIKKDLGEKDGVFLKLTAVVLKYI